MRATLYVRGAGISLPPSRSPPHPLSAIPQPPPPPPIVPLLHRSFSLPSHKTAPGGEHAQDADVLRALWSSHPCGGAVDVSELDQKRADIQAGHVRLAGLRECADREVGRARSSSNIRQ